MTDDGYYKFIDSRIVNEDHPFHKLLGTLVIVSAKVIDYIDHNPYTMAKNPHRQRRFLLKGNVGGYVVDHIWLHSKKGFAKFNKGDNIYISARLKMYYHNDTYKYGLGFPYTRLNPLGDPEFELRKVQEAFRAAKQAAKQASKQTKKSEDYNFMATMFVAYMFSTY